MKIQRIESPDYVTLKPIGELDASSSVFMHDELAGLIQSGNTRIHIDGSELQYISSAGIGSFIIHLDDIQKQGALVFSQLRDGVQDVFELLGLSKVVSIVNTAQEAHKILLRK